MSERSAFLESLTDTDLYSMGAFFCDEHPDLVDEVVARSEEIERAGLEAYARDGDAPVEEVVERSGAIEDQGLEAYASANEDSVEETFGTLLTGLAVRYYKAVAG